MGAHKLELDMVACRVKHLGEEVDSLRMEEAQPAKAMDVGPMGNGGLGRFRPDTKLEKSDPSIVVQ